MREPAARVREWTCSDQVRATLTHYPSGGRHPAHAHDHTQISFLLSGELCERLGGEYYRASGVARGHKPAGIVHDDEWGPGGALIFTVRLHDPRTERQRPAQRAGWAPVRNPRLVSRLVGLFTSDMYPQQREELLDDLLGGDFEPPPLRGDPPLWLKGARDAIAEVPQRALIQDVAREAGIHRVQLSRMFHRFYGIPPSLFRQRMLVARAVAGLVRSNGTLSDVAAEAGFYDQAHLTRSLRRDTGLTPGQVRALFASATSVQAPGSRSVIG
jgi:AraC-like DNA-binding protein